MKTVFADTVYWIAVARPNDQFARTAKRVRASLDDVHLVTTHEVLTEFLAALSVYNFKVKHGMLKEGK